MSGDSRKDFVLSSISAFFGYSVSDGAVSHVLDCGELNRFLDDPGCPLLAARVELSHGIRLVQAYNNVSVEETDRAALDSWLLFFKLEPCAITPDNIHSSVCVCSLRDSPLDSLYHCVQKVYAPVLMRDSWWSKSVDPRIQSLLSELEAGLGSALRRYGRRGVGGDPSSHHDAHHYNSPAATENANNSDADVSSILNPSDEFQYWNEVATSSHTLSSRERAQHFQELFQPIAPDFGNMDALSFQDVLELIEVTQDVLDDVWKQSEHELLYPEPRMRHLLEVMSGAFGRFVQGKLGGLDCWKGEFGYVRSQLQDGIMACER